MAILTYHHIGKCPPGQEDHRGLFVSRELFREQLGWLRRQGYEAIGMGRIHEHITQGRALPRRWVAITFDDGFRNNLTAGLPVLQEFGFMATIFLVTDRVGRAEPTGAWNDYLTTADLAEMAQHGVEFGSHTHTHPRLTKLNDEQALAELTESRRRMTEDFALPGDWFCYPYGNFSPRIAGLVKQAGYQLALSTIRDNRIQPAQQFWLPRVMVMNDTDARRLSYMLSHWYHWLHAWKNRKRWKSIR